MGKLSTTPTDTSGAHGVTLAHADRRGSATAADGRAARATRRGRGPRPSSRRPAERGGHPTTTGPGAGDGRKGGRSPRDVAQGVLEMHRRLVIALGILAFALVMLYGPARDYYCAWRTGLDLQATYDASAQSNERLTSDVQRLTTSEGIEDLARERGYVGKDETGVVVEGLGEEEERPKAFGTGDRVAAEVPWYVSALDVVFNYRGAD